MRCPICGRPVEAPEGGAALPPDFPFCSERCRLIDLGRWFRGEYRIPGAPAEPEGPRPAAPGPEFSRPSSRPLKTEETG